MSVWFSWLLQRSSQFDIEIHLTSEVDDFFHRWKSLGLAPLAPHESLHPGLLAGWVSWWQLCGFLFGDQLNLYKNRPKTIIGDIFMKSHLKSYFVFSKNMVGKKRGNRAFLFCFLVLPHRFIGGCGRRVDQRHVEGLRCRTGRRRGRGAMAGPGSRPETRRFDLSMKTPCGNGINLEFGIKTLRPSKPRSRFFFDLEHLY